MGAVQLSDDIERLIERQVREGRASSASAFLEDAERLRDGIVARLREGLGGGG